MTTPHIAGPTDAQREARRRAAERLKLETEQEKVRNLERHVKRLEATIRTFLSADKLTDPQRAELVGLLAGLHPHALGWIDPKYSGITKPEQRLIDNFRTMDANRRRIVSLLFGALAQRRRQPATKGKP